MRFDFGEVLPAGWRSGLEAGPGAESLCCVGRRGGPAPGPDAQCQSDPVVSERRSLPVLLDLTAVRSHPRCELSRILVHLPTAGLPDLL